MGDAWFNEHVTEPQIIQDFNELPQWRRKTVVLKCIEKPPDNVHSWLVACVRNFRTSELEKRLTGSASVHTARSLQNHSTMPASGVAFPSYHVSEGVPSASSLPPSTALQVNRMPSKLPEQPSWATNLLSLWPSSKSRLVGQFLSVLQPSTQSQVISLHPSTQACLAVAVALFAQENGTPDSVTLQCVQRLAVAETPSPCSVSTTQDVVPAPIAKVVQLQLVVLSSRSSIALVLAKSLLHVMERLSPGSLTFLPLVLVSLDRDAGVGVEAERLKLMVNQSVRCISALENFVDTSKDHFAQHNVKTFFVSVIDASSFSGADRPPRSRSVAALHSDQFRFLWTVSRCSQLLRSVAGNSAVVELVFAPCNLEEALLQQMVKLIGPVTQLANMSYNAVASMPTMFAVPSGCAVVKVCQGQDYTVQSLDGWRLPSEPKLSGDVQNGPINFLQRTTEVNIFQERALTDVEQRTVEAFTMVHETTGERRLCGREWWLRWYGYWKTPLQTVLDAKFPCAPTIFSVTGSEAPADAPGSHPCGRQRLCNSCDKALSVVDGAYCLPVMVDAAGALLVKAQQLWLGGDDDAAWARNPDINRTHNCGRSCHFLSG